MASSIGSLAVMITGNSSGLSKELKRAESETQGFARRMASGLMGGAGSAIDSLSSSVGSIVGKITDALTSPGALIGGAIGGFGLGALVVESVKLASEVEDAQTSFRVLLGDADKAQKMFADIRKFAAETPLTSGGLVNLSQSLIGAGIGQDQIIPTLRVLGDLAQGDEERLKGVANAYLQVRAKGKLAAEELNQFAERQVPLRPALAQVLNVSEMELGKLIETGRVGFPDLQRAMVAMTSEGGRFFNLMAEKSRTFSGLMSSLKDSLQVAGANFGQAIIDEFNLKPMIDQLTQLTTLGGDGVDQIRPFLRDVKTLAVEAGKQLFNGLRQASISMAQFINELRQSWGGMMDILRTVDQGLAWLAGNASENRKSPFQQMNFETPLFDLNKIKRGWDEAEAIVINGQNRLGALGQGKKFTPNTDQWSADVLANTAMNLVSPAIGQPLADHVFRFVSEGFARANRQAADQLAFTVRNALLPIIGEPLANQLARNISGGMPEARLAAFGLGKVLGADIKNGLKIEKGLELDVGKAPDMGQGIREAGKQFASAMTRGSAEAASIRFREQFGREEMKPVVDAIKAGNAIEQAILGELRKGQPLNIKVK